jgi:hypothetical protein
VGEVHRATPRDSFCVLLVLQRLYMFTCPARAWLWQYFKKRCESCIRLPTVPPLRWPTIDHTDGSHTKKTKRLVVAKFAIFATSLTQATGRQGRVDISNKTRKSINDHARNHHYGGRLPGGRGGLDDDVAAK